MYSGNQISIRDKRCVPDYSNMSGVYTCNSCSLQFPTGNDQRDHMKTDWHRYNLKRRVASLPAISEATFNSKLNESVATAEEAAKSGRGSKLSKKEIRRKEKEALLEKKRQLLEIARERMMQMQNDGVIIESQVSVETPIELAVPDVSKLDIQNDEQPQPPQDGLTEEQQAELLMEEKLKNRVEIPLEQCLFCTNNKTFKSFEMNLIHMYQNHGFYIPEPKYITDKEGLVKYMSEKIGLGNVCICCNYQGSNLNAVRSHMLSKRHCKLPYESNNEKLEISEFYNFESSYAPRNGGSEEDWEDVNDEDVVSEDEEFDEEDETTETLYHDGVELHLPTGIKVGHRSLQRYYRQDLRPEKELSEGQGTVIAAETRIDFITDGLPDRKTIQTQQRVWQTEVKDKKTHSKRAAKFINNQPYYRDQLLQ